MTLLPRVMIPAALTSRSTSTQLVAARAPGAGPAGGGPAGRAPAPRSRARSTADSRKGTVLIRHPAMLRWTVVVSIQKATCCPVLPVPSQICCGPTVMFQLGAAERAVRDNNEIRVDLPATAVHTRQAVLALDAVQLRCGPVVTLSLRGPERVALTGPNGSGKTTLLQTISGELPPRSGQVRLAVPARLLPQRMDLLDGAQTVAGNVARFAPHASPNAIRANLARLLFPGSRADQAAATLSGGELFRATLAALLLAEPAPQLLMLDEPTNNLDLASMRRLTAALRCYRGALLVASHDIPFLRTVGLTRWLRLEAELRETDPR